MVYLKPISGHTSVKGVQNYLEKNDRSLALDLINVFPQEFVPGHQSWSEQMDETRALYGNNDSTNGKKVRTYNHYILSPDPKDNINLEQLREFATAWAERFFGDFEVAIVYHDDNESGVIHAHIVVNNTNIYTGKRLAPYLTNNKVKEISRVAQEMALERGFHYFDKDLDHIDLGCDLKEVPVLSKDAILKLNNLSQEQLHLAAVFAPDDLRSNTALEHGLIERKARLTKKELELQERGGWSWKQDLRDRIVVSISLSNNESDFILKCEDLGVAVQLAKNSDFLFIHPARETWRVKGHNLGADYSRSAILRQMGIDASGGLTKPSGDQYQQLIKHFQALSEGKVKTIAYVDNKTSIPISDIARAYEINRKYDISCDLDYSIALMGAVYDADATKEIEFAQRVSKQTKYIATGKKHSDHSKSTPRLSQKRDTLSIKREEGNFSSGSSRRHVHQSPSFDSKSKERE